MDKYKGPVCRGCWQLGNNCKICERCIETKPTTLATRTDATPVAVEMVAELQLSAFLAGRGSIRTKANGNTHESSPGPTMDDYRRMARFALAEGWVDATPVAWMPMESAPEDEPILTAIKVNHKNGKSWWERHIIVIDSETGTISDMDFHHGWEVQEYTFWQPLPAAPDASYTHPPATDVAALVEALEEIQTWATTERRWAETCDLQTWINRCDKIDAALAPFTKGQP